MSRCFNPEILEVMRREKSDALALAVVEMFLGDGPVRMESAWEHARRGTWKEVALSAHILACLAQNLGAEGVQKASSHLEQIAAEGNAAEKIGEALFDLELSLVETRICLVQTIEHWLVS
jgi:hypothetical protein